MIRGVKPFYIPQCIQQMMIRKSSSKKQLPKNPIDAKMPTIRIHKHIKDELFDIAKKGETYSEVIERLINFYKENER